MLRFLLRTIFALATLAPVSCGILDADTSPREELRTAERRWYEQGIERYQYTYQRTGCECLPEWTRPFVIQVERDVVVSAIDAQTRTPAPEWFRPMTIADLFRLIDEALNLRAHELNVTYDSQLGYPTFIAVDYDRQVGDDEFTIHARSLIVMH